MLLFNPSGLPTIPEEESLPPPFLPPRVNARPRRGATAMEYLVMISFLFLIAMVGIGYFGQSTKKVLKDNADTIQSATQHNGPAKP